MRTVAAARARVILALVSVAAAACSEDRQPLPQDDGSSSSSGAAGSSSTGAAMPDLGAAESSTGPVYPLPTEDEILQCVRGCELPADCCPPSTEGLCPSGAFPYNFACIEGLCIAPPCARDDECVNEGEACVVIRGTPKCVVSCDGDDAVCTAVDGTLSCSGTADDGNLFCFEHCENPGVFCGNQSCDAATGECVCTSSGQCQVDWECV
jgi:hypothetical protein